MTNKRPVFVWLALGVLLTLSVTWVANIAYLVSYVGFTSFGYLVVFGLMMGVILVELFTFWKIFKGKKYARYLTILIFALASLLSTYRLILFLVSWPGFVALASYPPALGSLILNVLFDILLIGLVLAFIFTRSVAEYFDFNEVISSIHLPPPPPISFND